MAIRNITPQPSDEWSNQTGDDRTCVGAQEKTAAEVAARLGISEEALLAANPQITNPQHVTAGMEIRVPRDGGRKTPTEGKDASGSSASLESRRAEEQLNAVAMKAMLRASSGTAGTAAAAQPAPTTGADTQVSLSSDPRFADLNAAINASKGDEATAAATKLIQQLQSEKPPNQQLLNEARMGLAGGALMAGKLDDAQKALESVTTKSLSDTDKSQFEDVRDLLKRARQDAFTSSFQADMAPDAKVKDPGQGAAEQAKKLVELLQKTDPGNTAEIDEAKMRLANAQLAGGHYREAEKSLTGINEKQLAPEQKDYLDAIHQELHAQQIVALGAAYGGAIKHGNYKEAVSDANAVVNDLAKYFPENKQQLMAARLDLATAQLMAGHPQDARRSLAKVTADEFKAAPKELQERYKQLGTYSDKAEKEKAEQANIKYRLDHIQQMVATGEKELINDGVMEAQQLLGEIQRKHPDNVDAINGMKMEVAGTQIAAGGNANLEEAQRLLQQVIDTTDDEAIKSQAQVMQGQAMLAHTRHTGKGDIPDQTDAAVKKLKSVADTAESPETRKEAKELVIAVESSYVKTIGDQAHAEVQDLRERMWKNWGQPEFDENDPPKMREPQQEAMKTLGQISNGSKILISVMKQTGMTAEELNDKLRTSGQASLAKLPGVGTTENAQALAHVLNMANTETIMKGDFQGKHFTWDKGERYVDPGFTDSMDAQALRGVSKWVGEQVRSARSQDEELKSSDSILARGLGYVSGGILDGLSATNSFVKDKIKIAHDFYQEQGGVLGKVGLAATFVADQVSSVVTTPATIVDYKATDQERGNAIVGTALLIGGGKLLKAGGPAFGEALGIAGKRIATSRLGQYVANTWVGRGAAKIGQVLSTEIKIGGGKVAPSKSMEQGLEEALGNKSLAQAQASITDNMVEDELEQIVKDRQREGVMRLSRNGKSVAEINHALETNLSRKELLQQVRGEYSSGDVRRMMLGEKIYKDVYHGEVHKPVPDGFGEQTYRTRLESARGKPVPGVDNTWEMPDGKGYVYESEYWHVRESKVPPGEAPTGGGPAPELRRFYFNVRPEKAAELADYLGAQMKDANVKFNLKVPKSLGEKLDNFDRPDSLVLYVEKGDYAKIKNMVMDYAKKHPEAFADGTPAFTRALTKGISAADEPVQDSVTNKLYSKYSHGQLRSDLIAQTILDAPPGSTRQQLSQLLRQRMHFHGLDADRPWLSRGAAKDDF